MTAYAWSAHHHLGRVLRWAREFAFRRDGDTWTDGHTTVTWDREHRMLSVERLAPFTNEPRGADVEVSSIREALDVLSALHVLPIIYSPAYLDGVETGTVTQQRVDHEHYNRSYADMVHELEDVIVDLGVFADRYHDDKAASGCHPTPGVDCVDGCGACAVMEGVHDEALARIRDGRWAEATR